MKKATLILTILFFFFSFKVVFANNSNSVLDKPILFYGEGCPHCAKVDRFLQENNLGDLVIKKEIYHNSQNAQEFNEICEEERIDLMKRGVPFLYTKDACFIGDEQIISYFQDKVKDDSKDNQNIKENKIENLTIPILVGAALVDAINPCAFAVLLLLMTTILVSDNRKKALFSGIAFSSSIFISYFLMGMGLYSVIASIETTRVFMKIIAVAAIILGIFNLKDFLWYGKGFLMEVPLRWRPKMKKLISSVTSPLGAFFIGFVVSLFLLPCTSGPYIVIIGMLGHKATYLKAVYLLILYNLIFVTPMIMITLFAYWGMDIKKAEEKRSRNLRVLHLIAGLIMLGMGIYLLMGNV